MSRWLVFQSTLLMRGATIEADNMSIDKQFQSTLLMRGATKKGEDVPYCHLISIHAPHARSDKIAAAFGVQPNYYFNPRSSCEERPRMMQIWINDTDISIHAPHARSDRSRPS